MKYKVGDKVRVIACYYYHQFEIGEVVEITEVREERNNYKAESRNDWWAVEDDELESINDQEDAG